MLWQYRTSLFEFTKDGLLGDKYVDDEEMEKVLNELGGQEWELVSVSLLQDGLLAFLKRPVHEGAEAVVAPPRLVEPAVAPPADKSGPAGFSREPVPVDQEQEEELEPVRIFERPRKNPMAEEESDFVGDIRIS